MLVVGTGLVGTSVGLALNGERRVLLTDVDPARLEQAAGRGAGTPWDGAEPVDCAVVAVPPAGTAAVLADLHARGVAAVLTHVASSQARVQGQLDELGIAGSTICGGHPLAGREVTGPGAATSELFVGRPWVICPSPATSERARSVVIALAVACGAQTLTMSAAEHDRAVALSSHLPQIAASALAGQLLDGDAAAPTVSGPGLHDSTRIAASHPDLWVDILATNAGQVAPLAAALASDLEVVAIALTRLAEDPHDAQAIAAVRRLLVRGNAGRARVPVKRDVVDSEIKMVAVRIPDRPGALVEVLRRAAESGVNVEDVRLEHLPGRSTGVVELLVQPAQQASLLLALAGGGLEVLGQA
ncbi:MAG: prephenate dehydrogenase [Mycobacteriales bacterium]